MKLTGKDLRSPEGLEVLRHSASHVMADAVMQLFPGTRLGYGPAIEDGFYYDFGLPDGATFRPEDLPRIEAKMREIIAEDLPFAREVVRRDDAARILKEAGQDLKVQTVEELPPEEEVTFYRHGGFTDLCRGPHLPSTGRIPAFKLLSIAGAYWKGDERNPMLQRIYGTAFPGKKELEEYVRLREEAEKRDHRRLGRDLGLFIFFDEGPGFPCWRPRGVTLVNTILEYWRDLHRRAGYMEIRTPLILNESLWRRSGHWDNYRENMYFTEIDEVRYAVKPMNCPGGMLLFRAEPHSYRDLPMRVAELGFVHRHEKSGVLHGLFRVRAFTQDDAHIYCTPEQMVGEVAGVVRLILEIYRTFQFEDVRLELSTRPEKRIGSDDMWDRAEAALEEALRGLGLAYQVNPGDGAFYGPKIDFHIRDCMKRSWQCGTVQVDFAMPERFDIAYTSRDDKPCRPVMIHRAALGSIERFVGILIEHHGGAFPVWLAPVQARVLPLGEKHRAYAERVARALGDAGVRADADMRDEKAGYKIREATLEKIPYMLIVGDREVEAEAVSVRKRGVGDTGAVPLARFTQEIREEIARRS